MSYSYVDREDAIPAHGITPVWVRDSLSWDSADAELVVEAASHATAPVRRALDVGTGAGRLLPTLLQVADGVTAVDPDPERVARARERYGRSGVRFVASDAESFETDEPFDLVVCCHVLQHVARHRRAPLVASLRRFTSTRGVLVLMFSSATVERHFSSSLPQAGKIDSTVIDATEFDLLASRAAGAGERLPVWHARLGDVAALAADAGFHVLDAFEYRRFDFRLRRDAGARAEIASAADACMIAVPA